MSQGLDVLSVWQRLETSAHVAAQKLRINNLFLQGNRWSTVCVCLPETYCLFAGAFSMIEKNSLPMRPFGRWATRPLGRSILQHSRDGAEALASPASPRCLVVLLLLLLLLLLVVVVVHYYHCSLSLSLSLCIYIYIYIYT